MRDKGPQLFQQRFSLLCVPNLNHYVVFTENGNLTKFLQLLVWKIFHECKLLVDA